MGTAPTQTPATDPASSAPSSTPSTEANTQTPAAQAPAATDENFSAPVEASTQTPAKKDDEAEESTFSAPDNVEPLEYDLELPEDSLVPDSEFDALVEEATKNGLTKEEAQARLKLLDSAYSNAKKQFVKTEGTRLLQDLLQDPEFNTPEKQKAAKADMDLVYQSYKDPDFIKFVKENPLVGNNKHFVKFLTRLGKALRPETAPIGNPASAEPEGKTESPYKNLYPSHFEGEK